MSIETAIKTGATAVAASGGDDTNLVSLGIQGNKHTLYLEGATSLLERTYFEFSVKNPQPSPSAPGGSTQARATLLIKSPLTLANDNRTVNTVKIEVAYDPETTSADVEELMETAAQLAAASDFLPFWKGLNLT
jgi:hypothetical protein